MTPVSHPRNPLYPQSIPCPVAGPSSEPMQAAEEILADDKDIAFALALSESEARQHDEDICAQEEADLIKALEESRILSSSYSSYVDDNLIDERQDFRDGPSLSSQFLASVSSSSGKTSLTPGVITTHHMSRHPPEGESFLHMITPTTSEHFLDGDDSVPQTCAEGQDLSLPPTDDSRSNRDHSIPTPPSYAGVSTDDTTNGGISSNMSSPPAEFSRASDYIRCPPAPNPVSLFPMLSPRQSALDPPMQPHRRPSVANSVSSSSSSSGRSSSSESVHLFSSTAKTSQSVLTSPPLSFSSSFEIDQLDSVDEVVQEEGDGEDGEDGDGGADPNARPGLALTANQYVEPEMLLGVCEYSPSRSASSLVDRTLQRWGFHGP